MRGDSNIKRFEGSVQKQRSMTGGFSERSKKIVYQKGAGGGNASKPEFIVNAFPNRESNGSFSKPNPSFDFDIVRDIGTSPI